MARLKVPPSRLGAAPARLAMTRTAPVVANAVRVPPRPLRHLYATKEWRTLRWDTFKRDGFQCQWPGCGRVHVVTSELVADHIVPHRGEERLFWERTNLQTLCKSPCHDKHKQAQEQATRPHLGDWS